MDDDDKPRSGESVLDFGWRMWERSQRFCSEAIEAEIEGLTEGAKQLFADAQSRASIARKYVEYNPKLLAAMAPEDPWLREQDYRKALEMAPEDPRILKNLASCLQRTGALAKDSARLGEARAILEKLPQEPQILAQRALGHGESKDFEAALPLIQEALRLAPNDAMVKDARKRLEELYERSHPELAQARQLQALRDRIARGDLMCSLAETRRVGGALHLRFAGGEVVFTPQNVEIKGQPDITRRIPVNQLQRAVITVESRPRDIKTHQFLSLRLSGATQDLLTLGCLCTVYDEPGSSESEFRDALDNARQIAELLGLPCSRA